MNILNFLEKSVGKWFSQRTSYQLEQTEGWHQSDKTNVFQELLPAEAEAVVKLCEGCHLDPQLAIAGLQTRWEKTPTKPEGSSLLVPLRLAASDQHSSVILRSSAHSPAQQGTYFWGSDDTLIILTPVSEGTVEERLWFAAENLRLRTSFMTYDNPKLNVSSFYSEIRLGGAPPRPAPDQTPS
jgi:hypothetical protein